MADALPDLLVADRAAWRSWLAEHHGDRAGVWLVVAKKGTTEPTSLSYAQAVEEALCHGWIDGQARKADAGTYRQRFTPRRPRSPWSYRNVGIIDRLTAEGRMHPAGIAEVERAKADGRWDAAHIDQAGSALPDDLAAALAADPSAQAMFDVLTKQNRSVVLHQIHEAKRVETRSRRIERFVAMLSRGETPYPQRRRPGDG